MKAPIDSECRKQRGGSINRPTRGAICSDPAGVAVPNSFGNGAAVPALRQKLHIVFHKLIELLFKAVSFHQSLNLTQIR